MMSSRRDLSRDQILDVLESIAQYGVPASRLAWVTDVGTEDYLEFFRSEVMDDLVAGGAATCRFLEAVYGAGKTHVLDLLQNLALDCGMAVVRTDLSEALGFDDWKTLTRHILENLTARINDEEVQSLPTIVEALSEERDLGLAPLRTHRLPHPGFSNAIDRLVRGALPHESRERLGRFLVGERIGVGQLRAVGLDRIADPLSHRNAEQVLNTVVNALRLLGLRGSLLVFDENERSFDVKSKKVVVGANFLRRFIDACATGQLAGVVAVFGVLPGFLNRCALVYPALGQRLHTDPLDSKHVAWRWPVLPVSSLSTAGDPDTFCQQAINRIHGLVEPHIQSATTLRRGMISAAAEVLEHHAGDSFRRPLLKCLATLALVEICDA